MRSCDDRLMRVQLKGLCIKKTNERKERVRQHGGAFFVCKRKQMVREQERKGKERNENGNELQ